MRATLKRIFLHLPRAVQRFLAARYLGGKRRLMKRKEMPDALTFFVTRRCNCRCAHCFYWQELESKSDELNLDEVRRVAASFGRLPSISLTGGEPTLRSDLAEIALAFVRQAGTASVGLATNGLAEERTLEFCRKLLAERVERVEVQVSLDGLEETHDSIRRVPGAYRRAMATLKAVARVTEEDARVHAHAALTIQRANLDELEAFTREMRGRGVDVTFGIIRASDFGTFGVDDDVSSEVGPADPESTEPSVHEIARAVQKILEESRRTDPPLLSLLQQRKLQASVEILRGNEPQTPCSAGWLEGVLYAEGDVALCELTKPVGNVRDHGLDFRAVWRSARADEMRKRICCCFCTHGCNVTTMLRLDPEVFLSELRKGG